MRPRGPEERWVSFPAAFLLNISGLVNIGKYKKQYCIGYARTDESAANT